MVFSDGQRALPSEPNFLMELVTHPGLSLRLFRNNPTAFSTLTSLLKLSPERIQRKR